MRSTLQVKSYHIICRICQFRRNQLYITVSNANLVCLLDIKVTIIAIFLLSLYSGHPGDSSGTLFHLLDYIIFFFNRFSNCWLLDGALNQFILLTLEPLSRYSCHIECWWLKLEMKCLRHQQLLSFNISDGKQHPNIIF